VLFVLAGGVLLDGHVVNLANDNTSILSVSSHITSVLSMSSHNDGSSTLALSILGRDPYLLRPCSHTQVGFFLLVVEPDYLPNSKVCFSHAWTPFPNGGGRLAPRTVARGV